MKLALIVVGSYLVIGMLALIVFDLITGNIRRNLNAATTDTQIRVSSSGSYIGTKTSRFLIVSVMWLFWPLVLIGAAAKGNEDKENRDDNGSQK